MIHFLLGADVRDHRSRFPLQTARRPRLCLVSAADLTLP